MRASGIFTGTTSSLSHSLRQSKDRYTIRAGRNLPDKEFRYLRTVIVTAAVHRGFSSQLRRDCSQLTAPFNLPAPGRCQPLYVVFDLAETCVFVKQSPCAFHCGPLRGTPSPEVTELICRVPERVFSQAPLDIRSSSTCVGLRYGHHKFSLEVFLGSVASPAYESYDSGLPPQR